MQYNRFPLQGSCRVLGSASVLMGILASLSRSWPMKMLSASELTRKEREMELCSQRSVPGSVKQEEGEQDAQV